MPYPGPVDLRFLQTHGERLLPHHSTDLVKAILLLTEIPLYIGFSTKIGHPVGLGYKVLGSGLIASCFFILPLLPLG